MWRYRGGRDGHETLQQFMSFIGSNETSLSVSTVKNKTYPGVAIFSVPYSLSDGFQLDRTNDFGVSVSNNYMLHTYIVSLIDI